MNYKYINELERNLEIQAHSYLLQKDDSLFESQTRTELNQVTLVNRLKAHIGQFKMFYVVDKNIYAKIIEICAEFVLLEELQFRYLININQLLGVEKLSNLNSRLTRFEEKWNLKSSLRDLMLRKVVVQIKMMNQQQVQGILTNFFKDHFDLVTNNGTLTLQTNLVTWVKYKSEIEILR